MAGSHSLELTQEEKQWLAEKHVVRVRVPEYPPYTINSDSPEGLSIEYIKTVANRIGFEVKFVPAVGGWDAAMRDVQTEHRHFDLLPTMHRTPERERQFALSRDYLSAPWVIFTRRDSPYYSGLEALAGKTIASERGFAITDELKKKYPQIRIHEVVSSADALMAVVTGEADAYVGNLAVASYMIRANKLADLTVAAPTPFGLHTQAMAVRPDWAVLARLIDKGLATMSAEERAAIDKRWGIIEFAPSTDYELVVEVASLALLLLLAFTYWNRKLAREIALRKEQQARVEYLAYHDTLTNLPNRAFALEKLRHLAALTASTSGFPVLIINIRRFSEINRVYGHKFGDKLLVAVASRLQALAASSGGEICRFSDDQFFLILPDSRSEEDLRAICRRAIFVSSGSPYTIGEVSVNIQVSIGSSIYEKDLHGIDKLILGAHSALDEAKRAGLNQFALHDENMQCKINDRLLTIENLKLAIKRKEFRLHYQPKIDLSRGELVGFEALMRWQKPGEGLVSPGLFIPLAEEYGLIVAMSRWALQEACQQIARWMKAGFGEISIAVNVSPAHFKVGSLEADIRHALASTGIPARLLELELTESLLMEDEANAASILRRLRSSGVRISLDDFGTGYSSLSYLTTFDLDYLKIDQSFVRQLKQGGREATMCGAIIAMARKLGIKVVAEGIETADQLTFLLSSGAEIGQGYLFSKPIPAEMIERFSRNTQTPLLKNAWVAAYQEILHKEVLTAEKTQATGGGSLNGECHDARILIVDDTRFNIALISKILRSDGFTEIAHTEDPRTASELYEAVQPDLIILDLIMPHLNGFEVMESIRQMEGGEHTPIVVMTAELSAEARQKALNAGVRDFITKPFERSEVITRIRNVLSATRPLPAASNKKAMNSRSVVQLASYAQVVALDGSMG